MEFSLTTFVLEIVNFLVLLWILKRLFYRPVREAIARRRDAVEKVLADAQSARTNAEKLTSEYQGRLEDWQAEKDAQRAKLAEEIANDKTRLLEALQKELADERERQGVLDRQKAREQQRRMQTEANARAAAFAARMLSRVANTGIEADIVELFLEDCRNLKDDKRRALREALVKDGMRAEVTSAYALDPGRREAVKTLLDTIGGAPVAVTWHEDDGLLAGLSAAIGPWVLQANLRDELAFFAEAAADAG